MRQLYAVKVAEVTGHGLPYVKELLGTRSDFSAQKKMDLAKRFSLRELACDVRLCAESVMWSREKGSVTDEVDALKELLIRFVLEGRNAQA